MSNKHVGFRFNLQCNYLEYWCHDQCNWILETNMTNYKEDKENILCLPGRCHRERTEDFQLAKFCCHLRDLKIQRILPTLTPLAQARLRLSKVPHEVRFSVLEWMMGGKRSEKAKLVGVMQISHHGCSMMYHDVPIEHRIHQKSGHISITFHLPTRWPLKWLCWPFQDLNFPRPRSCRRLIFLRRKLRTHRELEKKSVAVSAKFTKKTEIT